MKRTVSGRRTGRRLLAGATRDDGAATRQRRPGSGSLVIRADDRRHDRRQPMGSGSRAAAAGTAAERTRQRRRRGHTCGGRLETRSRRRVRRLSLRASDLGYLGHRRKYAEGRSATHPADGALNPNRPLENASGFAREVLHAAPVPIDSSCHTMAQIDFRVSPGHGAQKPARRKDAAKQAFRRRHLTMPNEPGPRRTALDCLPAILRSFGDVRRAAARWARDLWIRTT